MFLKLGEIDINVSTENIDVDKQRDDKTTSLDNTKNKIAKLSINL